MGRNAIKHRYNGTGSWVTNTVEGMSYEHDGGINILAESSNGA